jgi:hypothetical protein
MRELTYSLNGPLRLENNMDCAHEIRRPYTTPPE